MKALYVIATSQDTARFKEITTSGCNYYPLAYIVALLTVKRDKASPISKIVVSMVNGIGGSHSTNQ